MNKNFSEIMKERDEAFKNINRHYRKAVDLAEDQGRRDRKAVEEQFENARKELHKATDA